jgi:hypothetical protein
MLTTYPNFNCDIAARIAELGRQPRRAKKLIEEHPTRFVMGTDVVPPSAWDYQIYYRFLTTADENFAYGPEEPPSTGRWRISALDLAPETAAGVIGNNARRLIPALRDQV